MKAIATAFGAMLGASLALGGCSSSSTDAPPSPTGFRIVSDTGGPLQAVAGDAVNLAVVQTMPDGSTEPLPNGASVAWSSPAAVAALPSGSDADSPFPTPGAGPTAAFIQNPGRPERNADLANIVFILDAGQQDQGTVSVAAAISGVTPEAQVTATIAIGAAPTGEASRGQTLYTASCAACHGATGHGSPPNADGVTFTLEGVSYDYPAPGLNDEAGNMASDPDWNVALLAVGSRSDVDNGGVTLQAPMPDWLATPSASTGKPLTTQDFADMYAFLATQSD